MSKCRTLSGLNAKQRAFCREYLVDRNATQAAIRAGYSERTARTIAAKLLAKDNIRAEIARLEAAQNKRLDITADKVKAEIAKIAFVDVSGFIDSFDGNRLVFKSLGDIPENIRGAIKGIKTNRKPVFADGKVVDYDHEVVVELWSKEKALEMLSKHFNLFEKHQEAGAAKVSTFDKDTMDFAQKFLAGGGDTNGV